MNAIYFVAGRLDHGPGHRLLVRETFDQGNSIVLGSLKFLRGSVTLDVCVGRGYRVTLVLPVHEGALTRLAAGAIFLLQGEGSASPSKS